MAGIVQISDFVAKYQLAKNSYSKEKIQVYIDRYEDFYIKKLLGAELGQLFIDDLVNGVPQNQIYIDIFKPFQIDERTCRNQRCSEGMKIYLLGLIYYEYTRNANTYNTPTGNKKVINENSKTASNFFHDLDQRHNDSIFTGQEIQWYCRCYRPSEYPTFNGEFLEISNPFF